MYFSGLWNCWKAGRAASRAFAFSGCCSNHDYVIESWRSWMNYWGKSCGQDPQFASGTLPFPLCGWCFFSDTMLPLRPLSGNECFVLHLPLSHVLIQIEWIHVMGFLKPIRNPSAWMSAWKYRFTALWNSLCKRHLKIYSNCWASQSTISITILFFTCNTE